jgi:anti-sigma factor RsiW
MATKDTGADKRPSDLELMMHLDGELSSADAQRVEKFLETDKDAKAKSKSLGQVSELVQGSVELEADDAEKQLAKLWSGIDKAIHANGASTDAPEASVESSKSVAALAEDRATDALVQTTKVTWFGGWGSHIMTGAFVAVAVAVLMMATRPDPVTNTKTVIRDAPPPVAIPVVLASQEPEVEELEVYEGSGVVMTMPGDNEEGGDTASTVIWISSDTDVVEDPI